MKLRRETSTFDSSGFAAGSLGSNGPEGAAGEATPGLGAAVPTDGRGPPTGVPMGFAIGVEGGFATGVDVGLGATGVPTGVDVGRGVPTIGAAFGFGFGSWDVESVLVVEALACSSWES